jgi:hypothetical protein
MGTNQSLEKVGECLYRNPSSGSYYALVKIRGKQIKQSLKTDNLPEARRKLRDFKTEYTKIDPEAGRITVEVRSLCRRHVIAGRQDDQEHQTHSRQVGRRPSSPGGKLGNQDIGSHPLRLARPPTTFTFKPPAPYFGWPSMIS